MVELIKSQSVMCKIMCVWARQIGGRWPLSNVLAPAHSLNPVVIAELRQAESKQLQPQHGHCWPIVLDLPGWAELAWRQS